MNRILLVEDDPEICEILQFYILSHSDYELTVASSGEQALPLVKMRSYDLILLDITLPGMDGLELCRLLRQLTFCPIIFISCLSDDETIIKGLSAGGDDYLVKPFQAPVLLARIEANLRRYHARIGAPLQLSAGDLTIDTRTHTLTKAGEEIPLSPTEHELLLYFFQNRDRFIGFDELYAAVWQRPSLGDLRSLFVHISHLRQKIEDDPAHPRYIRTHMRNGYIFTET